MKKAILIFLHVICAVAVLLAVGCSSNGGGNFLSHRRDTLYTEQRALSLYGYEPERALRIVDSAVIVGNLSKVRADVDRARIYSYSQMHQQLDSLLGGQEGVRLDTARAIGERVLSSDSARVDIQLRKDVLGILVYVARQHADSLRWVQRSEELMDVCRQLGDETAVLCTEAELVAARFYMGQEAQVLTRLDSIINALDSHDPFRFSELDAFVLASKRKVGVLNSMERYAETLPVLYGILERLDGYEASPGRYHDGNSHEPETDTDRADYIRFYRSQAQNFITAAYAALNNQGDMEEVFKKIEAVTREAAARGHQVRYRALEQQMEAERQQARAEHIRLQAIGIFILLVVALIALVWYVRQKRIVSEKNRALVRQIDEMMRYKKLACPQPVPQEQVQQGEASPDDLFNHLSAIIEGERLYLDPTFDRQTLIDRCGLSKERIGAAFAQGSEHPSLPAYLNNLRLEHAYHLLLDRPDLSIEQVAMHSGFSSRKYFGDRFKARFGITPTEFRLAQL